MTTATLHSATDSGLLYKRTTEQGAAGGGGVDKEYKNHTQRSIVQMNIIDNKNNELK